jgi:L-iditol 2-dehydrogenase
MEASILVCTQPGQLELQRYQVADPKDHEIQVEVQATVISPGTERAFILNLKNTTDQYPAYPGYSGSGIVKKIGKKVTRFKIGDKVAGHGIKHGTSGNIKENMVVKIVEGVSFEEAAFLSLGVIAMQGVRKARIEMGDKVMVLGMGLIGQLAIQLARINGSLPAIGADLAENRLQLAKECGADALIHSSEDDWKEQLLKETDGKGPSVVIESTGFPEAISTALEAVGRFGRVVLLGSTRGDGTVDFYRDVHKKGVTVIGAHIHANAQLESRPGFWTWQDDADCFMKLLQNNRIALKPLITERFRWEQITDAYERILKWNKETMGTVIQWQPDRNEI